MTFRITNSTRGEVTRTSLAVLNAGTWDDYSFRTSFGLLYFDDRGVQHDFGTLKIGYFNQPIGRTSEALTFDMQSLPENFFSLGQDVDYYSNIRSVLSTEEGDNLLAALRDVIHDAALLDRAQGERVFATSLMRGISATTLRDQFKRVLAGAAALSEFDFMFKHEGTEEQAEVELSFKVVPSSKPPTNIHVLIGRNGVGKTTLLHDMVDSVLRPDVAQYGNFYLSTLQASLPIDSDYFSGVVSVSFSAFDSRIPLPEQRQADNGVLYAYIGLTKAINQNGNLIPSPKALSELTAEFTTSLGSCLSIQAKKGRWLSAIRKLESDDNFEAMGLGDLADLAPGQLSARAQFLFGKMSSGHRVVLLSMTKLVDLVEEKTLVIMDEPESHLHPPLLSAFTRALSELLVNRNGVAIVATHSPVVLQEVPKSCAWILTRSRLQGRSDRPTNETFGENVGVLTREVFGLEVSKSGFHEVLKNAVDEGISFEQIKTQFSNQLGFEAQAVLRVLVADRDRRTREEI